MKQYILFLLLGCSLHAGAQSVGIGTTTPNTNAALEIKTVNKGLLMPRIATTVRLGMSNVPAGMMVYDNNASAFYYHDGGKWRPIYDINADSSLSDYSGTPQVTANMTTFSSTTVLSGILYDNGGPAGNYSNNSNNQYVVQIGATGNDSVVMFKVVIEEMNLESPTDYILIWDEMEHRLQITGTTTGTYYFPAKGDLNFQFVSNAANTQAGFKIRWTQLLGRATETPPAYGWFFNPEKRAVRGGVDVRNGWANDSIGRFTFGFGSNTQATGRHAVAIGEDVHATGSYSVAIGNANIASNAGAVALGQQNIAGGAYSFAGGIFNDATGTRSVALGEGNEATGSNSFAAGKSSRAKGTNSVALGNFSIAKAFATVIGQYNDTLGNISENTWVATEPLFTIGNGSASNNRENALMVLKNGKTGIGTNAPSTKLHIAGGTDVTLADGSGYLVLGDINSTNVVFDNNEIQARNNGVVSTLTLQNSGGAFEIGGTAAKPGGGSWSATSDARLKQNIQPYRDGLQQLRRINPVVYQYNKLSGYDTQRQYIGVLAQELKQVAPYMVGSFSKDNTEYYNVDNTAMTYMLINAVKEQQQQIEKQQAQIEELKDLIRGLLKK